MKLEEGTTEKWMVTWFPPDDPELVRVFDSEEKARQFATTGDAESWFPILEHWVILAVSEMIPISEET